VSILKLLSAILKGKTRLATTLAEVESNSASAVLCVTIPGIEQKKSSAKTMLRFSVERLQPEPAEKFQQMTARI